MLANVRTLKETDTLTVFLIEIDYTNTQTNQLEPQHYHVTVDHVVDSITVHTEGSTGTTHDIVFPERPTLEDFKINALIACLRFPETPRN